MIGTRPRIGLAALLMGLSLVTAIKPVNAGGMNWSDETICGAGVYNYFFLKAAPDYIGNTDGWYVFRSASGGTYDCQLQGDTVALRWKNDGGAMTSRSTRYGVDGLALTINGDFGPAHFRLDGETWSQID